MAHAVNKKKNGYRTDMMTITNALKLLWFETIDLKTFIHKKEKCIN